MLRSLLNAAFVFLTVGGTIFASPVKKEGHVLARLGVEDTVSKDKLYIYSKTALRQPAVSFVPDQWELMKPLGKVAENHIYESVSAMPSSTETEIYVRGLMPDDSWFVDKLTKNDDEDKILKADFSKWVRREGHVAAEMGAVGSETENNLFITVPYALRYPALAIDGNWQAMELDHQEGTAYTYRSAQQVDLDAEPAIQTRGLMPHDVWFVNSIDVDGEGKMRSLPTYFQKEELVTLNNNEIFYGSAQYRPQTIALWRVNYLVNNRRTGHLGSGVISTCYGTLCEGWGMGPSAFPHTCYGAGQPLADATQRCPYTGMTHRVRFYRGGTHP